MSKEVTGHAYAREVLTVTYADKTQEKFYGISEQQHEAFIRQAERGKEGQPVDLNGVQQGEFLETLRKR